MESNHEVNGIISKETFNNFLRIDDIQGKNSSNHPRMNGEIVQSNGCTHTVTNVTLLNGTSESEQTRNLADMPSFFKRSHIYMSDPDRVRQIIQNIINDGPNKLQIIADWDYTITIGHINGEKALSSWDVMEESKIITNDNRENIRRINDKHMKEEFNHSLTPEDKRNDTIKWYRNIYDEILNCKLTRRTVEEIVKDSGLQLRKKSDILFKKLHNLRIPTMVCSAGFGDFILDIIKLYNINMKYIKVISNFFLYDRDNRVVGFTDPIYPFNKKEATTSETEYYKTNIERTNAILIGDTIGDAKMDGGIIKKKNILRIGFLNGPETNPEHQKIFKQYFDVVVVDEQSMDTMIAIIDALKQ